MSAADALVDALPRTTLVLGKGGVGKTTCASAIALHSATRIGPTLLLTTDPARALPSVLETEVDVTPTAVPWARRLSARLLDAAALRNRFMEQWGDVIRTILDRGTYLDDSDIGPLVDTALPGSDEIFAALELARLLGDEHTGEFDRVVVDTAPTGHTLRLLNLPKTFRALVSLLDSMQAKHRFMVKTLTHRYRADTADDFLKEMSRLVSALEQSLGDPARTAAVMVTNPETLVREETSRYAGAIESLGIHLSAVIWNGADAVDAPLGTAPQYRVPRLEPSPTGKGGLARWLSALEPLSPGAEPRSRSRPSPKAEPRGVNESASLMSVVRPLTIVAGKGGVGKTTVACAIALAAAHERRTLLVSTDPAPSLSDALAQPVPDADTPVVGVERLFARQMDATAAFARLRTEYQDRVDALFQSMVTRGVDLTHDRAVARDLLSLAPPGVDEVYALSLLSDALFRDQYECVVVDPAPTGHLLRLLEMPALALAWSHQLLRLMLKYKDVAGLGDTAGEVLEFARSLRAVDALLRDRERCAVVIVTLDEPVVQAETRRLGAEVRRRGVAIVGAVTNRVAGNSPLPVIDAPLHFEAPRIAPPPVGAESIARWTQSWTAHAAKKRDKNSAKDVPGPEKEG